MIYSTDSFARINQQTFGQASDGEDWSYAGSSGTESIQTNEGRFSSVAGDSFAVIGSITASTVNVLVRVETDDNGNFIGALARYTNVGGITGYRAGLYNQTIQVDRYVSGSRSSVGSTAFSYAPGSYYWIMFICDGDTLTVTAWADGSTEPGSPQLTLTDSAIPGAGQYGVSTFLFSGDTRVDHLTVTDNQPDVPPPDVIAPLSLSYTVFQNVEISFAVKELIEAFYTTTQKIILTLDSRMANPNSTVTSTATVQDATGAAISNLSVCSVTVYFPDGSSSTFALNSGVTNAGSGKYTITYATKGAGRVREEWSVIASDGTTKADYLNFYTVAY